MHDFEQVNAELLYCSLSELVLQCVCHFRQWPSLRSGVENSWRLGAYIDSIVLFSILLNDH